MVKYNNYSQIQNHCIKELKKTISEQKQASKHNTKGLASKYNKQHRKQHKALYKQALKLYIELISKKHTIKVMQELDKDTLLLSYKLWRV